MGGRAAQETRKRGGVEDREPAVPLTALQRTILALLARNRAPDSYLAGGAALHMAPHSIRYSNDLDFFHDSTERVANAFREDSALLQHNDYEVDVELSQPGFIRAVVARGGEATRIDWAHDSAWRFLPPVRDEFGGFVLHDIDLAVNKALALAGRDEPRDYVDMLYVDEHLLALGAVVWAAAGKDPGFTPLSLLELLKRRGKYHQEELDRLDLTQPIDVREAKKSWLAALGSADVFVRNRPPDEAGALYYHAGRAAFNVPAPGLSLEQQGLALHFGTPGGVLPQPAKRSLTGDLRGER